MNPELDPILSRIPYDKLMAELCRQSFYDFVKEFWDTRITEKYVDNWHIKYICDILEENGLRMIRRQAKKKDLLINLPPGTSKSTIISIMFPAWLWCLDPSLTFICVSYSKDLALELAGKSRDVIASQKYQQYYPYVKLRDDQAAKGNFQTTRGGARHSMGVGGTVTGLHAHCIITDDAQNPKQANSTVEQEITNNFIQEVLPSRKVNKTCSLIIHLQQRLNVHDITGTILAKGLDKFDHICIPGEILDIEKSSVRPKTLIKYYKNGLLDPVRLSRENLDEIYEEQGARAYNSQVLQSPQYDAASILQPDWFEKIDKQEFKKRCKEVIPVYNFYLDTSSKDKTSSDPSCILVCCKVGELLYLTGVSLVKKLFMDLLEHIQLYTLKEGYTNQSILTIEPRSSGYAIFDYMKTQTSYNITECDVPKDDKDVRLQTIAPRVKGGKVILVEGDWTELFLSEVTAAQPRRYDQRDCLYMAIHSELNQNANEGNYQWSFVSAR
jgi:hypothetical protein